MEGDIVSILRDTAKSADGSSSFTHLTLFNPRGRWELKPEEAVPFLERYCDAIEKDLVCGLAERAEVTMPVIAKIRLRFQNTAPSTSLYNDKFLLELVYCYQIAILDVLRIDDDMEKLYCCVLEPSSSWFLDGFITVDIRLQFPYCQVDSTSARAVRGIAISNLLRIGTMSKLAETPIDGWEQIINPSAAQENLPMYGSVESPDQPPLKLKYIIDEISEEELQAEQPPTLELHDVFDPAKHRFVQQGLVEANILQEYDLGYWLPLFFSTGYCSKLTLAKTLNGSTVTRGPTPKNSVTLEIDDESISEESHIEIAERFLAMMHNKRIDEKHYWLDIGRALSKIHNGEISGLTTWIKFTERSSKRNIEECRVHYPDFIKSNKTLKTLAWYAREDSPENYHAWHRQWFGPSMRRAVSLIHDHVAEALYRFAWLEHACFPAGMAGRSWKWYYFTGSRWVQQDDAHLLIKFIKKDFISHLRQMKINAAQKAATETREQFKLAADILDKELGLLINKLGNFNFKGTIIKAAQCEFHSPELRDNRDANEFLIGCSNCVMEVIGKELITRPGKPEDYITMNTGTPYLEMGWNHPQVKNLLKWTGQILTNKETEKHLWKQSASWFRGRNAEKKFFFWSGPKGNNAKSTFLKLVKTAMGPYAIDLPVEVLANRKIGSSGPNPELARAQGCRIIFLTEPDEDDSLRSGIFRRMTGGDSFYARFCHDNGGEIDNMAKMCMLCNDAIKMNGGGGGEADRLRTALVPFDSVWSLDAPETEEEQYRQRKFKLDPYFESRLPSMAPAFLWIAKQYFSVYMEEGLDNPPEVLKATERYWNENDVYSQFTEELILRVSDADGKPDSKATLTFTELYPQFKIWYTQNVGPKVPEGGAVRRNFNRLYGTQVNRHWIGIRLREITITIPIG